MKLTHTTKQRKQIVQVESKWCDKLYNEFKYNILALVGKANKVEFNHVVNLQGQ
jgi:hypothetical protein